MSSRTGAALAKIMREQQILKALEVIIGQGWSEAEFLEQGRVDNWKLARIPRRAAMSLVHFDYRAEVDHVQYYQHFIDKLLRASVSFDGAGREELVQTIVAVAGKGGTRTVKRKGWIQRNLTQRGQPEYDDVDGE